MFDASNCALQPVALRSARTSLPTDNRDLLMVGDPVPLDPAEQYCVPTDDFLHDRQFKVGDKARLVGNGMHDVVDIKSVDVDSATEVPYFTVDLSDGHDIRVTKEFLSSVDDEDVAGIPVTLDQVREHLKTLTAEEMEALLSPPDVTSDVEEIYAWHYRLGHLSVEDMTRLSASGLLPKRFLEVLKTRKFVCPYCIFGKCKRRSWRSRGEPGKIRKDKDNVPGARVSADHVISAQPGLVPRLDGRHTRDRINSACVFYDHASGFSYSHMQTSVDNQQTIQAKHAFEAFATSHGIDVKAYHADNGIFAEQPFRDEVDLSNQKITYCGVGAHHQNGIVERHIQTLTLGCRTNLLHAQRRWGKAIGTILWPFAWRDFERRWCALHLDEDGRSALNKFTGVDVKPDLKDFHPFGCPVFVLDERLQSSVGGIPKWEPRARVGVYLGQSPCHAGNVALVLNPRTLHVSPQFHVVFDDEFSTVKYMNNGEIPPHWEQLCKHSCVSASDKNFNLATTWANNFVHGKPTSVDEEDEGSDGSGIILNHYANAKQPSISEEVSDSAQQTNGSNDTVVTMDHQNLEINYY
jgi:hypothetical protein